MRAFFISRKTKTRFFLHFIKKNFILDRKLRGRRMVDKLEIGNFAPEFSLVGNDGLIYALNQYKGYRAVVIFFTSDLSIHAIEMESYLKGMAEAFYKRGVAFLSIHPNAEPEMKDLPWKSLCDPTQAITRRYGAQILPHFFLFDSHRMLVYSGRAFDNSREHLKEALLELLDLQPITVAETDPIGTHIEEIASTELMV